VIDIIDRIDEATASVCGWCSAKLTDDNYSGDFCSEDHQENWNAHRMGWATPVAGAGMVFYDLSIDISRFDAAVDHARESMDRFHRAVLVAGRRMFRAASIPQRFLFGDWTDIGFTTGGVIEATPPDEPPTVSTRAERMQAALDARRNRNTGPRHRPRAPKILGGRAKR
jgi:hypothetical protein